MLNFTRKSPHPRRPSLRCRCFSCEPAATVQCCMTSCPSLWNGSQWVVTCTTNRDVRNLGTLPEREALCRLPRAIAAMQRTRKGCCAPPLPQRRLWAPCVVKGRRIGTAGERPVTGSGGKQTVHSKTSRVRLLSECTCSLRLCCSASQMGRNCEQDDCGVRKAVSPYIALKRRKGTFDHLLVPAT